VAISIISLVFSVIALGLSGLNWLTNRPTLIARSSITQRTDGKRSVVIGLTNGPRPFSIRAVQASWRRRADGHILITGGSGPSPRRLEIGEHQDLEIYLSPDAVPLGAVVVDALGRKHRLEFNEPKRIRTWF
jgi:hypothetical protein